MHDFLSIFEKVALLFFLAVSLYHFGTALEHKIRLLMLGKNEDRLDDPKKRLKMFWDYVLLQKKVLKAPIYGAMHGIFFWGFLIITIETFNFIAQGFCQSFHLPLTGNPYFIGIVELVEVIVMAALGLAFYRRLVLKPKNLSLNKEGLLILSFISTLMISALLKDAFEIAMAKTPNTVFTIADAGNYFMPSFIGNILSSVVLALGLNVDSLHIGHNVFWWIHVAIVLVFLVYIPSSKHSHLLAAMVNVFFGRTKPIGQLSYIDMDTEMEKDTPVFGVNSFENYTWRQLLDVYACTECGRCQVQCPAYFSGKPLNPKKIIIDLRHELYETGEKVLGDAEKIKSEKGLTQKEATAEALVAEEHTLIERVFEKEEIWACTTCLACVEACPVLIEHVDKIIDVRRHLVMMEADMSEQVVLTFNNIENQGNPWGIGSSKRGEWTEGLNVKTFAENPDAEYLYFVGCAASFDEKNKKVARSLVKIMNEAGLSYAILGSEETCTGDPARRIGNEYLFQTQAKQNIETMNGYNVKKVITACPHCFNTIKNEYTQFGGNYEVIHHSELIYDLIQKGKIKPQKSVDSTVAYHDSCYLGRYNKIYDAPREILKAIPGIKLVEMEKTKETGMCCGAGGGRMWMEETIGQRINELRTEQAVETGANIVASACPFCKTMLSDGIGAKEVSEKIENLDIAEIVEKSLT